MSTYLFLPDVLRRIEQALDQKRPLSLVRIGDGENIVLAQKSIWPIKKVMREPWAHKSRRGQKGVTLPNLKARDQIVRSIRAATIVGILPTNDTTIKAPAYLKRRLTNQLFKHYGLHPAFTCHACANRMMPQNPKFYQLLKGRRILILNKNPRHIKSLLERPPHHLKVTRTIRFSDYGQINQTLKQVTAMRHSFDIALISCGINAVILAPQIAQLTGKVALDFGKAPRFLRTKAMSKPKL
ncbi:GT-D fold domain-containing glycosyltransferase [Paenibacillus aestuarii]|uniref:GT-D fold domain-containing glycosyltransferase n=1 Tax=Paenibacillus aestuarii TaxID=516965 RepID=A0ABW0K331_9BACL|nr:GT-D fold domain-containing glycosyltransferase [Paenibacillus aestuarii]